MPDLIAELEAALRRPVNEGGYDGYHPDPLHIAAADAIKSLRSDLGTEQTMHAAWRKRAEEAEARETALLAVAKAAREFLGHDAYGDYHSRAAGVLALESAVSKLAALDAAGERG